MGRKKKGMKRETMQAVFNLLDHHQARLYEFATGRTTNESGYLKMLIQRDMDGWKGEFREVQGEGDLTQEMLGGMI